MKKAVKEPWDMTPEEWSDSLTERVRTALTNEMTRPKDNKFNVDAGEGVEDVVDDSAVED